MDVWKTKVMSGVEILSNQEAILSFKKRRKFGITLRKLFRKIDQLDLLLKDEGVRLHTGGSLFALELYSRIGQGLQKSIVTNFSLYVDLLTQLKSKGLDLWDSRLLTWAFLKELRLQPCIDTFSSIESEDMIEIFNKDYIQVFRNLPFLASFDFPMFDLLVLDWTSLYLREALIQEKIFFQMEDSFRKSPKVRPFDGIMPHFVEPRFQNSALPIEVEFKVRSPLLSRFRKTRKNEMLLVTSQALRPASQLALKRA